MEDNISHLPTLEAQVDNSEIINDHQLLIIEKRSPKPEKPESEDATFARNGVLVVADGVSRNFYDKDKDYSPAAKAAKIAVEMIGATLQTANAKGHLTREDFTLAFSRANQAVRTINENETYTGIDGTTTTLAKSPDFYKRDLAGAVASAMVREGNTASYGFIGDCQIIKLSHDGEIIWSALTPETNKVSQAKDVFNSSYVKQLPS